MTCRTESRHKIGLKRMLISLFGVLPGGQLSNSRGGYGGGRGPGVGSATCEGDWRGVRASGPVFVLYSSCIIPVFFL